MQQCRYWLSGLFATAIVMTAVVVPAARAPAPHLPKGWKFRLPAGDVAAGQDAIRRMQCYSCHTIVAADFPEARSAGGIGPELGPAYAGMPPEFLAESIINRHRYIAGTLEHYRGLDRVSSKMGDYSSIMTVRELLDIVAYLKAARSAAAR